MSGDILNSLAILKRPTLREVLLQAGIRLQPGEEIATGKLDLLDLMGIAVVDMGIEYFIAKCDGPVLRHIASSFGVSPSRQVVADQVRCLTLLGFLQQTDIRLLVEFSEALGLYKSPNKYCAVAEISEEILFCGVRELFGRLNVSLLQRLCSELRLLGPQPPKEKEQLVNRILCRLDA
eukprot:Phypoly_transcript_17026.p1 GENE.Phypoly_transcript_17026~~Phypoly_transcript_17026.p1  ORF type:complete len:178 (+),score=33.92 Phypoly_transcript_17026:203-736(+)